MTLNQYKHNMERKLFILSAILVIITIVSIQYSYAEYVTSFGSSGFDNREFGYPAGIITNSTHIFVADNFNNQIQIFKLPSILLPEPCQDGQIRDNAGACIIDTVQPVITASPTTITLQTGESYAPPTVTIYDNDPEYTKTLTTTTTPGPVDTSVSGNFTISYTAAADRSGNVPLTVVITVNVIECPAAQVLDSASVICAPDIIPPVITVNSTILTLEIGESYAPPTVVLTDNDASYTGNVTTTTTPRPVDTSVPGTFTISYTATADAANNIPDAVTVTVKVSCPDGQLFNGTACVILVFDHVKSFGSNGNGDGEFYSPQGITTNSTHLFIVDANNHRVQIFDIDGNYVAQFGNRGIGNGEFNNPIGITTNFTHIFVADTGNSRIQVFDINGNYVGQFGKSDNPDLVPEPELPSPPLELTDEPVQPAPDPAPQPKTRTSFVSDGGGGGGGGGSGSSASSGICGITKCPSALFSRPSGVTTNSTHIFVADRGNDRIQIFDIEGNYVGQFGFHSSAIEFVTKPSDGGFNSPQGITTNSTHIFVSDTDNHRVQVFDIDGNYVAQFGGTGTGYGGSGSGEFNYPRGITTTSTHIYVADSQNHRVQVFDIDGNYVAQFGSSGFDNREFGYPAGIITNSTHIFVADNFNNQIQIFKLPSILLPEPCQDGQIRDNAGACIIDTVQPVITASPTTITLQTGESYAPPTVTIYDNDPEYTKTLTTTTTPGPVDTSVSGNFTISYTAAADRSGNVPLTVVITVNVIECPAAQVLDSASVICAPDIIPPVITVNSTILTLEIGESYAPPTVVLTDNDASYTGNVTTTTTPRPVDTSVPGTFTISYTATADAANNIPDAVTVTVKVSCPDGQLFNGTACVILVFDHVKSFGSNGNGDGEFYSPQGITTNSTHLFIVDANNHRVQIFDIDGNYVAQFGNRGIGNGEFNNPIGITTNFTHIFVADTGNSRIQVFDINGNYVGQFGKSDNPDLVPEPELPSPPLELTDEPVQPAPDPAPQPKTRTSFVSDGGGGGGGGGSGSSASSGICGITKCPSALFSRPSGVTTNSTHIFVADRGNDRIQIFDIEGNYVGQFGFHSSAIEFVTKPSDGGFNSPQGITTNSTHIFVSDTDNHRVQVFDIDGNYVAQFGGTGTGYGGSGSGEFNYPRGITTTSTHIYVADSQNHRVQVFDIDGNYVAQFGSSGFDNREFGYPAGIITNSTHIFVADNFNNQIQIFKLPSILLPEPCQDGQIRDNAGACIIDTVQPVITASPTTITLQTGESYAPPTVTIYDNDPEYTKTLTTTTTPGPVDTSVSGNFTISYTAAADRSGNVPLTVVITVNVIECPAAQVLDSASVICAPDIIPPVITVNSTILTLEIGESYAPPTVVLTDNDASYTGNVTTTTTPRPVDTSVPGTFTISYTATADAANNIPDAVTVTVKVSCPDGQLFNGTACVILVFDHVKSFGSNGNGDGEFYSPQGITTNSTHLFIVDANNHRVQIFDIDGNYVAQFGNRGIGNGEFNNPIGITTNFTHIFVADTGNSRIQVFDINGNYVGQFGKSDNPDLVPEPELPSPPLELTDEPVQPAPDPAPQPKTRTSFVSDGGGGGGGGGSGSSASSGICGITKCPSALFSRPSGVTTNSTHIFVADRGNDRIQIFDIEGNYVGQFGFHSSAIEFVTKPSDGGFNSPQGITTNSTHIFVSDTDNHRVQVFDIDGNYVAQFGGTGTGYGGSGSGEFNYPRGITTTSTHIYVADSQNHRVQVFDMFVSQSQVEIVIEPEPEPPVQPTPEPKTRTSFGGGSGGGGSSSGGGGSSSSSTDPRVCGLVLCSSILSNETNVTSDVPSSNSNDNSKPPVEMKSNQKINIEPVESPPEPADKPVVKPPPPPPKPLVEPVVEPPKDDFFTIIMNWFKSLFG